MFSTIINSYFEQISIYKSVVVHPPDYDTYGVFDDLTRKDFPIKEFSTMSDHNWEDERMFLVSSDMFGDFLKAIDHENITVIFCIGDAYEHVHNILASERKMFKCYILRL